MENNDKIKENTGKLLKFVHDKFMNNELNNDSLLELIQLSGLFLNIQTIPDYAKTHNMSYEGAKKFRNVQEIFGVKFVIEND